MEDFKSYLNYVKENGSKIEINKRLEIKKPMWFDEDKFKRGKKVGQEYFFSVFIAHLSGLVLLVYNESIINTLISTGKSSSIRCLFERYFNTAIHIKKWYEGNVWCKDNYAYKSLCLVNLKHKKAVEKRNSNLIENVDFLKFSQLDMFFTQFAFMGFILDNRNNLFYLKEEDLVALIHFWRSIGYLLGIDDEFNFFKNENLEFQKEFCKYVFDNEFKSLIENDLNLNKELKTNKFFLMSYSICCSVNAIVKYIYAKTFLKFTLDNMEVDVQLNLSLKEKLALNLMKFILRFPYSFKIGRFFFNTLLNLAFNRCDQKFEQKKKILSCENIKYI